MKFSVIIPVEFHRGQGAKCLKAWCCEQAFPKEDYEVICVMPRSYPAAERGVIEGVLRPHDLLLPSDGSHDMTHCVEGAARARGDALFFTESHVWPEPGVLRLCATVLEQKPDWAGFSCKTLRVTSNRLAEAEADMYEEAIDYGVNVHPWRKILDQCFMTRRKEYFAAGGFDDRLGHFAEWVLAASYYSRGFKIGYTPHIILHHFYIGKLSETDTFTNDFIDGEIAYFSKDPDILPLLEPPREWSLRGNFDRGRARYLIRALLGYGVRHRPRTVGPGTLLVARQIAACLPVAVGAAGFTRLDATLRRLWRRGTLAVADALGSQSALARHYNAYQAALVRERRLRQSARLGKTPAGRPRANPLCFGKPDADAAITRFLTAENLAGIAFRWSKPAAIAEITVPEGRLRLRLRFFPNSRDLGNDDVRFFFNERPVPPQDVTISKDQASLIVDSMQPGMCRLAWICQPWLELKTRQRLGLALVDLHVERVLPSSAGCAPA